MTANGKSPSIVARTAGCLWRLIKLFIAIVLGILLGVLLYWGGYYAYTGILAPINTNHTAINMLEGEVRRTRDVWEAELKVRDERIRLLSEQVDRQRAATDTLEQMFNARLADEEEALRQHLASQQEAIQKQISSLGAQQQSLMEAIGSQEQRGAALSDALRTQQATLQAQQEAIQSQQEQMAQIATAQSAIEGAIADTAEELKGEIAALQKDFDGKTADLEAEMSALQGQIAGPEPELAQLRQQTLLLKAAAQALRVRIRLVQNNPGGAREDLARLDATLTAIAELPEVEADTIVGLRDQVAEIRTTLDENPFVVSEQLDVLWLAITDLITLQE